MKKQTQDEPKGTVTNPTVRQIIEEGLPQIAATAIKQELNSDDGEDYGLYTVAEAVKRLTALYQRSLIIGNAWGMTPDGARGHAEARWRAALPEITNKHNGLIYIAAVAWGMRNRVLDTNEAKTMIFLVQTQLTVLKMESTSILRDGTLPVEDNQPLLPGIGAGGNDEV